MDPSLAEGPVAACMLGPRVLERHPDCTGCMPILVGVGALALHTLDKSLLGTIAGARSSQLLAFACTSSASMSAPRSHTKPRQPPRSSECSRRPAARRHTTRPASGGKGGAAGRLRGFGGGRMRAMGPLMRALRVCVVARGGSVTWKRPQPGQLSHSGRNLATRSPMLCCLSSWQVVPS